MKGKYITTQILMACYSKRPAKEPNIHEQLEETIAERKKIIQQYELTVTETPAAAKKTIHAELEETISVVRKAMQQYGRLFAKDQATGGKLVYMKPGKIAA